MSTAILVDGGYYIKRYRSIFPNYSDQAPAKVAKVLHDICRKHLQQKDKIESRELLRIYYYDCPPLDVLLQNPISKEPVNFSTSKEYFFRQELHQELRKLRKVALRMGRLAENGNWQLKPAKLKQLLQGELTLPELMPEDVFYAVHQKGIDLKIGMDIATLAFKKLTDQIILIAGDSDFVPAAKLARREGIDFVLDPMWNPISDDLYEHIDGLRSTCPNPRKMEEMQPEGLPVY